MQLFELEILYLQHSSTCLTRKAEPVNWADYAEYKWHSFFFISLRESDRFWQRLKHIRIISFVVLIINIFGAEKIKKREREEGKNSLNFPKTCNSVSKLLERLSLLQKNPLLWGARREDFGLQEFLLPF